MPTSPLDYFKALVVCCLAAFAYERAVVPLIVQKSEVQQPPPPAHRENENPSLHRFFPPGAWQHNNPRQIETELGVLLFRDWERISDNRWSLSPVTLLLNETSSDLKLAGSGKGGGRPIMLNADQGAEIEFAESLHVIDGSTPPVKEGHLKGNVQIIAHATKPDGSDHLQIDASDVLINGKKIWTTANVRVKFGAAEAIGRDLTINMTGNGQLPTQRDDSPLSVLNDLTLIYLQKLSIPLKTESLWPPLPEVLEARQQARSLQPAATQAGITGTVNVACRGGLRFDFATYTMSLREEVLITHQGVDLPADQIRCKNLEIELEDPFGNSVATPKPEQLVRRIRAFGGPVTISAPTLLAHATADIIDADLRSGMLRIDGREGINVKHRGMELLMSGLEYRFRPGSPTDLIHLKADGEGKLIAHDPSLPLRSFTWAERLWVTPQSVANKYQLYLMKASAILPDDGRIQTDSLVLGFTMLPTSAVAPKAAASTPAQSSSGVSSRFRPEKLVAEGNVKFDTSEIYAETNRLDLYIQQVTPNTPAQQKLRLTKSDGSGGMRMWTREPAGASSVASFGMAPTKSRPRPRVSGGSLSASILTDGENAIADGFRISHAVRIDHVLDSPSGPLPVVLTGREVTFADDDKGRRVLLAGTPAEMKVDDGYFRGPMVQLNIDENFVFMDQPGEFQLPTSMLASLDEGPSKHRWIAPPRCTWGKQMFFNGTTATLLGNVTMGGSVATLEDPSRWDMNVVCDQVEVELKNRLNFNEPQNASKSEVKRLSFQGIPSGEGAVMLSAIQVDQLGKMLGKHQMRVPNLNLMPETGDLTGEGPGWYHMWTQPDATSSSPMSALATSGGWLAAHLVYEEAIRGNVDQKVLSFLRSVRIAVSPVPNESSPIDANRITDPMEGQAILACDELRFSQTPTTHQFNTRQQTFGAWEAEALANVSFAGRNDKGLFNGTAHRLGYAANKDLFVIAGDGNRPARFQRVYSNGQTGPSLDAYEIQFKPSTFEILNVRLSGSSSGNIDQLRSSLQQPTQPRSPVANPANPSRFPQPKLPPSQRPPIQAPPQNGLLPFRQIPQATAPTAPRY